MISQDQSQAINLVEIAMRGAANLLDIQMAATRQMMQWQARTATMIGAPDCSHLFSTPDGAAQRVFRDSAEQMLNLVRQSTDTLNEINRSLGDAIQQQTVRISEDAKKSVQELSKQAEQGMQEFRQTAERQLEEATRPAPKGKSPDQARAERPAH